MTDDTGSEDGQPKTEHTKERIAQAALDTLRTRGFKGASAREIAATGGFNQALIFYHYATVQNALLAALDLVSERRMQAYRDAFKEARSVPVLAGVARRVHAEDVENGYVTVLAEMVAGGVTDAELGAAVAQRMRPWIELVASKLRELLGGSLVASLLPVDDIASAMVAGYLGLHMLGQLEGDHRRIDSLLALVERYGPLAEMMMPGKRPSDSW
jgi:AcrR family transcriptional regulator